MSRRVNRPRKGRMARGRHLNPRVDPLPRQSSGKGAKRDIELLRMLAGHAGPVRLADLFPGRFVPTWAVDAAARVDASGFAVRLPGKGGYAITDMGRKFLTDLNEEGKSMRIEGGFCRPVTTLWATTEGLTLRIEEQDDPGRRVAITFGEGDVRGMAEMLGLVLGDAGDEADGTEPTELDGCPGAILAPELGGEG